jgi:single-strand DNA-binding protein
MEFLNRIEIQGIIGMVKITPVGDTRVARFSVCTETTYKGTEGIVIDCTWFQITAWESETITCLDQLEKGKAVRVSGRVRVQRYTDNEGIERQCWEVMAREVEILKMED